MSIDSHLSELVRRHQAIEEALRGSGLDFVALGLGHREVSAQEEVV